MTETNYVEMPFLDNLVELKLKSFNTNDESWRILDKCPNLKTLLIKYNYEAFIKTTIPKPMSRLFTSTDKHESLSRLIEACNHVKSRKTYINVHGYLIINL